MKMSTVRFEKRPGSCKLECQVVLLDNALFVGAFEKKSTTGQQLFDRVCDKLVIPSAGRCYFGLQFTDFEDGELNWLDLEEKIRSQRRKPYSFQFAVKFFPSYLQKTEKALQTQFMLQIKHNLIRGKLTCSANQHALLDGFFAQAVLGDYKPQIHSCGYLEDSLGAFFAPPNGINSDIEVTEARYEALVRNLHKGYRGMTREEASMGYLENAQKLKLFGMSLHRGATDKSGNNVLLAIYEHGVLVFNQDRFGEVGDVEIEFRWNEIVTMLHQNRKFYVVIYSEEKRDGGSYSFRFHGHYGHKAAQRILNDALQHQVLFFQPKLNRRSRSFGEIDSHGVVAHSQFTRGDKRYATTSGKVRGRGNSLSKLTSSFKKKIPRRKKSRSDGSNDSSEDTPQPTGHSDNTVITYV